MPIRSSSAESSPPTIFWPPPNGSAHTTLHRHDTADLWFRALSCSPFQAAGAGNVCRFVQVVRRGRHWARQLSGSDELAIPSAQPFLSFPCDVTDRLGQTLLPQQLLSADPCR